VKLILVDPNRALCEAWERAFHVHPDGGAGALPPDIEIRCGFFQDIQDADALVTAGNSFGLMDGGVDLAVARAFPGVDRRVQEAIRSQFRGELNVGAALVVPTGDDEPRYLVYAPTMRVPLDIRGTDAVYRAMWAALIAAGTIEPATGMTLVVPGLGTGAGKMSPGAAAEQMALAWRNFNAPRDLYPTTWTQANHRHHEIAGRACCAGAR
jgi:O-acetyl-ADP-ribose deacetylase (regulator of RNase III)